MSDTLLSVDDLWVRFPTRTGTVDAVRGVSFSVGRERVGIVGESGSGKSMTGRSILRLIRPPGQMRAKSIAFNGKNLLDYSERQMRKIRGHEISMVMQDPKFSLNPVHTVGKQICEALRLHTKVSRREARQGALEMLEAVQIRNPERVFASYPHELSGGMGQRVMIAMMLITDPKLLIADEPTSALDVTVQMKVLAIMDKLVQDRGMGLIFISHDLNLVSSFCDRIIIMYAGRIVETCKASELHNAVHPYTRGLLNALPRIEEPKERLEALQRQDSWKQEVSVDARV